jgi:hypothetical protein
MLRSIAQYTNVIASTCTTTMQISKRDQLAPVGLQKIKLMKTISEPHNHFFLKCSLGSGQQFHSNHK